MDPGQNRHFYITDVIEKCDRCLEWFHLKCLGLSFNEDMTEFYCDYCSLRINKQKIRSEQKLF